MDIEPGKRLFCGIEATIFDVSRLGAVLHGRMRRGDPFSYRAVDLRVSLLAPNFDLDSCRCAIPGAMRQGNWCPAI